jgi:glycopeptide antibiotics resistance protein
MHTSSPPSRPIDYQKSSPLASGDHSRQKLAALWARMLVTLSFLAIVFCTLFPFNFTVPHGMTLREAAAPFDWRVYDPSDPMDTVNNIILFIPFGFALACLALKRSGRLRWAVPLAALVSCTFACSIEFLQQWLPLRDSSLADICSNTTGGIIGAVVFLAIGVPLLRALTVLLTRILPRLPLIALSLIFLYLLAGALRGPLRMRHLRRNLATWDTTYALAVGNEPMGEQPWEGTVAGIDIAAAALSPSQIPAAYATDDLRSVLGDFVLAAYRIEAQHNSVDLTHQSPDLAWMGSAAPAVGSNALSADHWLRSTEPMSRACGAIRDASRFTVRCRFQADHPSQAPEAGRILTIALNSNRCNLRIEQHFADLVISLRTLLTGGNGTNSSYKITDFFLRPARHDLIITYDDPVLRVYLDGPADGRYADVPSEFGGVSRFLPRTLTLPFGGLLPEMYRIAFYLTTFAPLALVIPILALHRKVSAATRNLAMVITFLAPTLAMQFVQVIVCHHTFRTDNLLIGFAVTALVAFPMTQWLGRLDRARLDG